MHLESQSQSQPATCFVPATAAAAMQATTLHAGNASSPRPWHGGLIAATISAHGEQALAAEQRRAGFIPAARDNRIIRCPRTIERGTPRIGENLPHLCSMLLRGEARRGNPCTGLFFLTPFPASLAFLVVYLWKSFFFWEGKIIIAGSIKDLCQLMNYHDRSQERFISMQRALLSESLVWNTSIRLVQSSARITETKSAWVFKFKHFF